MKPKISGYLILISVLLMFVALASANDPVATNMDESVDQADGSVNYVLGRPVESSYEFDVEAYQPIDTALLIDNSGSMYGVEGNVKSAARDYIDNTNTAQGDENGVGILDQEVQGMTGSKSSAKQAVSDTYTYGGNSCFSCGINTGIDLLEDGDNSQQVMIILADAQGGGDPSGPAQNARDKGIELHGIMFSGADRNNFETYTGASECEMDSSENSDGDNCWYGTAGSVDDVYDAIRRDVSTETDATLRMRLNNDAYSSDTANFEAGTEYNEVYNDIDDGSYSHDLEWRPTSSGYQQLITGNSEIFLNYEGGSDTFDFTDTESYNVEEVDFNAVDFDAERRDSGDVDIEVEVENVGTVSSRPREVSIIDNDGNRVSENLPGLSVGESHTLSFNVDASNSLFNDVENLNIIADYQGYWSSVPDSEVGVAESRGATLEANEGNNELDLGYPPRITNIGFNDWTDHHGFEVTANINMLTGPGDFGQCRMSFTDQDGDRYPSTGMVQADLSDTSSTTAECRYDSINNSIPGFNVYDTLDVNVSVTDDKGTSNRDAASHEIPNQAPDVDQLISPPDDSIVTGEEADLEVEVSDSEGDEFNLTFFNAEEDTDIFKVEDAHEQPIHDYIWEIGLGDFEWGVRLEDPYDTYEKTWGFRRVISESFRLEKSIEYRYSSLIVSESGRSTLVLETVNTHPEPKNITTDISTVNNEVNVSFASYNGGVYQLDSGESKRFQIEVSRDEEVNGYAEDTLKLNSTDQQIGAETVQEFPVYVRSSQQESRGVPGLTATMIYIIGLVSVLLFGLSV